MTTRRRRIVASAALAAVLSAGCGLDDGARVRNQDNVRDADSESVTGTETESESRVGDE